MQKVASGKFLCVGDRRNRENCERTWARRPCFKEKGKFQSFLLYFLYFTKSRKIAAEGGGEAAERQKDLIGFVRSCCLCALIRGLQNLESPFGKDLILLVGSCCLGGLIRGLQNLELPERETDCYFLRRAKSNQKACSDVQKVAGGKFLCVGDRRNRENCERTWARRPCFKETTPSCDLDSNLRSIRSFILNDRRSSCNRPRRKLQTFRVSPVRIWIGAKGKLYSRRKIADFRKRDVVLQAHSRVFADEICWLPLVWVWRKGEVLLCWEKAFLYRVAFHKLKKQAFFAN